MAGNEELSTPLIVGEPPREGASEASGGSTHQITSEESVIQRPRSIWNGEDVNASQSPTPNTPIQKVPNILRCNKDFNKYLEPMVVSIGPYHYNKVKLKPGETLKLKLQKQFIRTRDKSVLYHKILNNIERLRNCYDKEATKIYNDETLARMLFVDGCSVLYFVHCYVNDESLLQKLKIKHHEVVFMLRDLFLLENQLPFGVLKELMGSEFEYDGVWKRQIQEFIRMDIERPRRLQEPHIIKKGLIGTPDQTNNRNPLLWIEPPHLLHLLRGGLIRTPDQSNNPETQVTMNGTSHILDISGGPRGKSIEKTKDWHSFRNVTELKAVGIHLKASDTNCVTDVSFKSSCCFCFCTHLKLPRITVDSSTMAKFLNLVAYEMTPGFVNGLEVTSYICFLDSLIDHPNDVKELREDQVLYNFLGSDKEVAKLFNMISNDLVPNPELYKSVIASIQKHFHCRYNTWIAKGLSDHFSSPWTMIAFFAAIFVIILTFLQTYYTMFPPT
ncbi:hypothetical protein L1049_007403 [Liquidambar formosana]|uniref:Uncharacterized protein n=1 Tax=Liquidambar formosana TaxID=63359 RepID=A0AAP0R3E4_LIQFO